MLFNNQDMYYFIQKIQCKGKSDKYTIFHKYGKDMKFEEVTEWAEKLKNFNSATNYENYKCVSLRDLKLPYNKILSMDKNEVVNSKVDFYSIYSIESNRNKYLLESRADKELIFKVREFLKSNKLTYMIYLCKDNKYGMFVLFREQHKHIMEELCLMIGCSEKHLNDVIDNY